MTLLRDALGPRHLGPRTRQMSVVAQTTNPSRITVLAADGVTEIPQVAYLGKTPPAIGSTVQVLQDGPQWLAMGYTGSGQVWLAQANTGAPEPVYEFAVASGLTVGSVADSANPYTGNVAVDVPNSRIIVASGPAGGPATGISILTMAGALIGRAAVAGATPGPVVQLGADKIAIASARNRAYVDMHYTGVVQDGVAAIDTATGAVVATSTFQTDPTYSAAGSQAFLAYSVADDAVYAFVQGNSGTMYGWLLRLDADTLAATTVLSLPGSPANYIMDAAWDDVTGVLWLMNTQTGYLQGFSARGASEQTLDFGTLSPSPRATLTVDVPRRRIILASSLLAATYDADTLALIGTQPGPGSGISVAVGGQQTALDAASGKIAVPLLYQVGADWIPFLGLLPGDMSQPVQRSAFPPNPATFGTLFAAPCGSGYGA